MKTRTASRAFLGVVCMAFALPALAQNLLQNPHFDGTLDPWIPFFATYDGDHSAKADGTGSAFVSVPDSLGIGNQALVLQQCVSGIVPGATYTLGGTMRIPASGLAAGATRVEVEWHAASDCSDDPGLGFGDTSPLSAPPGPTDTWVHLAGEALAPPGAIAANVYALAENDGPLPASVSKIRPEAAVLTFNVSIDDLFLGLAATAAVPTLGGVGIAVLLASLAGAAIFLLRR
jgi:hypothetical protein